MVMAMIVRMVVARSMAVSVIVTVRVSTVRMAMIVPMVSMSKGKETDHVDDESQSTDNKQLFNMPNLCLLSDSLKSLPCKLNAHQHQKYPIPKPRQCVELAPAVRSFWTCRPFRSDCSA